MLRGRSQSLVDVNESKSRITALCTSETNLSAHVDTVEDECAMMKKVQDAGGLYRKIFCASGTQKSCVDFEIFNGIVIIQTWVFTIHLPFSRHLLPN